MSIFVAPALGAEEERVLGSIDSLLKKLGGESTAHRWYGTLRRTSMARAVRGSNSIEGYRVTVDDALAAGAGEEPLDADRDTWRAVTGYQRAMTFLLQKSEEPGRFEISIDLIQSMHFMMIQHDLSKRPGRWRDGPISVVDEVRSAIVYRGPDFEMVPALMDELADAVNQDHDEHVVIQAAMAHLNLAMIHPFKDGNGRMARCLQTMVLARDKITNPIFSSIEEYLGANTARYYDVLAGVGQGAWHPERDAREWIRFCLTAHFRQATTVAYRKKALQGMFEELEHLLTAKGLPPRSLMAAGEAAMGYRVRNATYRASADVSLAVASKDLKALADAGLLEARGESRGRHYVAAAHVFALGEHYRNPPRIEDPFSPAALPAH
ncbi:MAG: Fic family protein [bacterium]